MKFLLYLPFIVVFVGCTSKLDKPENLPMLLDNSVNPNLKISIEAFVEQPVNRLYLDSNCVKTSTGSAFDFSFTKDSSYLKFRNDKLEQALIKSKGQFLNYGIEIGQSYQDVFEIFSRLQESDVNPYIHLKDDKIEFSCCVEGNPIWVFNFENDQLKTVIFN